MITIDEEELTKLDDELIELRRIRRDNDAEIADLKKDVARFKRRCFYFAAVSISAWCAALACQIAHKAH